MTPIRLAALAAASLAFLAACESRPPTDRIEEETEVFEDAQPPA